MNYLRLLRAPNAFTAVADIAAGYLLVHTGLVPVWPFVLAVFASVSLYSSGMVLNDVFDIEVDRRERPERPLPSGLIPLARARFLGMLLMIVGVLSGWAAGYVAPAGETVPWRSGVIATILAVCILAYNGGLKRTVLGPATMGSCRGLNLLLGAATGLAAGPAWLGLDYYLLFAAGGLAVYIAGVTWFARHEAEQSSPASLTVGLIVMLAGIAVLGCVLRAVPELLEPRITLRYEATWWLLLALLVFPVFRRCLWSISEPSPERVQSTVKHAIFTLILLDAALGLLLSHPAWSLGIVALLPLAFVSGRWVYST